ncbi:MAG: HipA domain-containing protein [Azoarcus sp.]|jgi:hypothetical protein|nr:HipA domain-containing protein [Azoarcus sp.]
MTSFYPILKVTPEQRIGDESLGTKEKFWFRREDGSLWLFKEVRAISQDLGFSGEDWAEKVAAEMARFLDIPAAEVELAEHEGRRGCASKSFIGSPERANKWHLMHGNEVLAGFRPGYNSDARFGQSEHTLENIIGARAGIFPGRRGGAALAQLASYIVLDALIGNTDRHHENWGIFWHAVDQRDAMHILRMAPTYDHASSLGRELSDRKRADFLGEGTVERYVRKGRGGIYMQGAKRGENPLCLAEFAAARDPAYFEGVLGRLRNTPLDTLAATVDRVPDSRISSKARDFAKEMLKVAYTALTRIGQ